MTKDEALKLAFEALKDMNCGWKYIRESHGDLYGVGWDRAQQKADDASEALRQALEQPEQEPVAWELRKGKTDRVLIEITNNPKRAYDWKCSLEEAVPLYTAPPSKPWVSLTDDEYASALAQSKGDVLNRLVPFARAIEAKLKEKNHG